MKRLWISLATVFLAGTLHAATATVNATDVQMYKKEDRAQVIGVLSAGMVVSVDREKNGMCLVNFERLRGWVEQSAIGYYPNRFSNVSGGLILCETIFSENNGFYLYYTLGGKLNRMNIFTQTVENTYNVGEVNEIYPSSQPNLFLLEGVFTNRIESHTLKLFDTKTGKEIAIGCFDSDKVRITGATFSQNGKRLAVLMLIGNKNYTAVYATDTGKMLFYAKNAQWAYWFDPMLILNDNDNFWSINMEERFNSYDAGYEDNRRLFPAERSWVIDGRIDARPVGSLLYIETSGMTQVYDTVARTVKATSFRGLDFDMTGTYNYYFNNDLPVLKNIKTGSTFSEFSGEPAKKEFVRFCENRVIYRMIQDRIEALFLFDPAANVTYKYKVIDSIGALGANGIAAESVEDNGLYLIAIEIPEQQKYYIHFIRGQ